MLIAIGGRSGSGKTNVAKMLQQDIESVMIQSGGSTTSQSMSPSECVISLIPKKIIYIGMDNFYIETNGDMNYNYDHPDAFDWNAIINILERIKRKEWIKIPIYDYKNSRQSGEFTLYENYDIVIFEGILALASNICHHFDVRIYVNADSDICLWRRIQRDVESRGRTINSCGKQFFNITKKGAIEFIIPRKKRYSNP